MRLTTSLLLSTFFVASCGGGGSSNSPSTPPVANGSPTISNTFKFNDSSGDGLIENEESFTILLTISDPENDSISGSVGLNGNEVSISAYSGSESFTHQATINSTEFGELTIDISVSDNNNSPVTGSTTVEVYPNSQDISDKIANEQVDYVTGGEFDGIDLIGVAVNSENANIGYVNTALTEVLIDHNMSPNGVCGNKTPHKIVEVKSSPSGITIGEDGLVFPLECITESQATKIQAKMKKHVQKPGLYEVNHKGENYIAQTITVTVETTESGVETTSNYTGSGIELEGNIQQVFCSNFEMDIVGENTALLNGDRLVESLDIFESQDKITLDCERRVMFNGLQEVSPLLGKIEGVLERVDSLAPIGSIDNVRFTVPFNEGGLDVGDICVSSSANDESGEFIETLELVSSDGLSDTLIFGPKNNENETCLSLSGLDGDYHVEQSITDGSENTRLNKSLTYSIFPNLAPVFSAEVPDELTVKQNTGEAVLVTAEQVSDPENHDVKLSGDLVVSTSVELGEYEKTIIATDEYNASSEKTINLKVVDNFEPVASPVAEAGSNMAVPNGSTVQLDGSSSTDPDGDSLTYQWEIESKPTGSRSVLSGSNTVSPTVRVDRQGSYEISLVVNDGKVSSAPSSIIINVEGRINPLSDNIDVVISNINRFYGFAGTDYTAVLQSASTGCSISSMDIDQNGIIWGLQGTGENVITADPAQPRCEIQGRRPFRMFGFAVGPDGTLWGTTQFNSDESSANTLVNFEKDGTLISETRLTPSRNVVYGIDFAPDGTLYGVEVLGEKKLVEINPSSGVLTDVSSLPVSQLYDIDIGADNILRLYDQNGGRRELKEFNLDGSLRQVVTLESLCTSCGFVGIVARE